MSGSHELPSPPLRQDLTQALHQSVFVLDRDLRIVMALSQWRSSGVDHYGLNVVDYIARRHADCIQGLHRLISELSGALQRDTQGVLLWPLRGADQSLSSMQLRIVWHQITPSSDWRLILSLGQARPADRRLAAVSQALPAQKAFVNQLVHELRTPLAIASGSLKRAGVHVPESLLVAHEHLSVAEQELRRIRRLVDHLSLLTDVETGSKRWALLLHPAGALLSAWQRQISPALERRLVRLVAPTVLDQCVYVAADALSVVIDNLCDNAMRYSHDASPVVLLLTCAGPALNLYVADWGSGIPASQRDHVFDPFRRLEEHRDPARADGSGLGLSVCRSLVEMMHGTIRILPAPTVMGLEAPLDCPSTVVKVSLPRLPVQVFDASVVSDASRDVQATLDPQLEMAVHQPRWEGLIRYLERCGETTGFPRGLPQ